MARAFGGLQQIVDIARPHTVKRLLEAGALTARSPLGIAGSFPWLLGRGPSLGILSRIHAITMGDRIALHDEFGSMTWSELESESNVVARALQAAGVNPGDKIALLLRNGRHSVISLMATQKMGVVCCPLNTWAKPKELKAVASNVDPSLLIYDTAHSDQVRSFAGDHLPLVHVGDPGDAAEGSIDWQDFVHGHPSTPLRPFTLHRGTPKVVIQTSGTTGTPKGAARDVSSSGLGALANLLDTVPFRRADVIVCPAPIFHSFGLATTSFSAALGATIVLPRAFDPEETLALIERHRATALSLVPVMVRRVVALPDEVKKRYDVSSLRILLASGSAMSRDLKESAARLFGDVIYDLYGSTEVGWVAIARPEDMEERPASVGRPATGIELAILDAEGNEVAPGVTGEIHVRSDVLFEGYTSGDQKVSKDGYMPIGDLGHLDDEGYLFVESRSDDMVVIGGENVYPIEIENLIEALPEVQEVSVLGISDPEFGQVLAAVVVGDTSESEVLDACRTDLASYKVPRVVKIVPELPRTATGKVLKRDLAAFFQE